LSLESKTLGDGVTATAVERPSRVEELQDIVRRRAEAGEPIYPQGGGTSLNYGGVPRAPGVAIETRSLARVIDYPAADMTITVEAGMTLAELAATLDKEGQRLTLDAPDAQRATLGGIYATNTSGPRRYGLGRPRDQIIGISFVTSDGEVIKGGGRVVKNVAGYDFPRLLTGSMGTLGIITQMTLKVRPKPESSALVWVKLATIEQVGEQLDSLNVSLTRPVAIELLNQPAADVVGQPLGLSSAPWILAVGFEDNAPSVAWQRDKLLEELAGFDAVVLEHEPADRLWRSLIDTPARFDGILAFEAHLPPSETAAFAGLVDAGLWLLQAHAGTGVVRGYARGEVDQKTASDQIHTLRSAAVGFGGSLTLPRCPTVWKHDLRVWGYPRPDWGWCEKLKQTLDPRGVLNPGRFVGNI
jgi:glycolate oxidase FAD binding subunit